MYQYDGLGRLVIEATGFSSGNTTWNSASQYTHYYYAAGQVVETRVTASATERRPASRRSTNTSGRR